MNQLIRRWMQLCETTTQTVRVFHGSPEPHLDIVSLNTQAAVLCEGLAKPEIINSRDSNYKVIVNPTPKMLRKMLEQDRYHEVRIITLGQDIAICPSWGIIHQDMGSIVAQHAHPAWINRHPTWYMGDGCWFLNQHPEGMVVNDKQGRIVPSEEWPLALQRAVGADVAP